MQREKAARVIQSRARGNAAVLSLQLARHSGSFFTIVVRDVVSDTVLLSEAGSSSWFLQDRLEQEPHEATRSEMHQAAMMEDPATPARSGSSI